VLVEGVGPQFEVMSVSPDRQVKGLQRERAGMLRREQSASGMEEVSFGERQVLDMVEEVRQADAVIGKALRAMIPDPPVRTFLVNADRALDAVEVVAGKAPWLSSGTASGRQGPEVQILSLRPAKIVGFPPDFPAFRAGFERPEHTPAFPKIRHKTATDGDQAVTDLQEEPRRHQGPRFCRLDFDEGHRGQESLGRAAHLSRDDAWVGQRRIDLGSLPGEPDDQCHRVQHHRQRRKANP
jgi:hypothetical protein